MADDLRMALTNWRPRSGRSSPSRMRQAQRSSGAGSRIPLRGRFPRLAELMDEAEADVLAYATFRLEHRKQIWSNNPLERVN